MGSGRSRRGAPIALLAAALSLRHAPGAAAATSCDEHCGDPLTFNACGCDAMCAAHGDCCANFYALCATTTTSTSVPSVHVPTGALTAQSTSATTELPTRSTTASSSSTSTSTGTARGAVIIRLAFAGADWVTVDAPAFTAAVLTAARAQDIASVRRIALSPAGSGLVAALTISQTTDAQAMVLAVTAGTFVAELGGSAYLAHLWEPEPGIDTADAASETASSTQWYEHVWIVAPAACALLILLVAALACYASGQSGKRSRAGDSAVLEGPGALHGSHPQIFEHTPSKGAFEDSLFIARTSGCETKLETTPKLARGRGYGTEAFDQAIKELMQLSRSGRRSLFQCDGEQADDDAMCPLRRSCSPLSEGTSSPPAIQFLTNIASAKPPESPVLPIGCLPPPPSASLSTSPLPLPPLLPPPSAGLTAELRQLAAMDEPAYMFDCFVDTGSVCRGKIQPLLSARRNLDDVFQPAEPAAGFGRLETDL